MGWTWDVFFFRVCATLDLLVGWLVGEGYKMDVFKNYGYPQIIHFNRVFHQKPSILGYPYFWKHPNIIENGNKFK